MEQRKYKKKLRESARKETTKQQKKEKLSYEQNQPEKGNYIESIKKEKRNIFFFLLLLLFLFPYCCASTRDYSSKITFKMYLFILRINIHKTNTHNNKKKTQTDTNFVLMCFLQEKKNNFLSYSALFLFFDCFFLLSYSSVRNAQTTAKK